MPVSKKCQLGSTYFRGCPDGPTDPGPQACMFSHALPHVHAFFIKLEVENLRQADRACHTFASYASIEDFWSKAWAHVCTSRRCFYEIICGDRPARLYFDIEWTAAASRREARQRVQRIVGVVTDLLRPLTCNEPEVSVTDGSREVSKEGSTHFKHSFHVVVTNVWFASNHQGMKHFVQEKVLPALSDEDRACVDAGVYTPSRVMRMVGCHKFTDATKTALKPLDGEAIGSADELRRFLITVPPTEHDAVITNEMVGWRPPVPVQRRRPARALRAQEARGEGNDNDLAPLLEEKLRAFGYREARIVAAKAEGFDFDYDHSYPDPLDLPEHETYHSQILGYVVLKDDVAIVGTYSQKNRKRKDTLLCRLDGRSDEQQPQQPEEPRGWDVAYLEDRARSCDLRAITMHVRQNVAFVINGNKPFLVTRTWDGQRTMHKMVDAKQSLAALREVYIRPGVMDESVLELEAAITEEQLKLEQLSTRMQQQCTPELKRERKVLERNLEKMHQRLAASTESVSLADLIQRQQPAIMYNNLVFRPDLKHLERDFNLFSAYAAERLLDQYPDRYPEAVQPILDHIKNILCDGSSERYDFTLKWIAHVLQNPMRKCGVALVFRSEQGAGKGRLFEFLKRVIGEQYVLSVADNTSLTGQFNSHRANKLLILANELGSCGAAYKEANVLKSMITDEDDYIEPKGVDRQPLQSVSSLLMFTNEWKSVRIDPGDRRYCVQECNDGVANNAEYFAKLQAAIDDPKAQVEFFRQMREIDIENFHFGSHIPRTQYRAQLQDEHIPVTYAFLREKVQTHWADHHVGDLEFKSDYLFQELMTWLEQTNNRQRQFVSAKQMGQELSKLGFKSKNKRLHGSAPAKCYDFESRERLLQALQKVGVDCNAEDAVE